VLNQFRLPRSRYHWLLSLLAVLDAAGLDHSLRPSVPAAEARLLLLSGVACVDDLTSAMRLSDAVDQETTVTDAEFGAAVSLLRDAGYPVQRSAEDAWPAFQEWRARYGAMTERLLDTIAAPPAPWSGTRSLPAGRRSVG
jgi:hypothetical protein